MSAPRRRRLGLPEFSALLALLFANVAFAIDAMLPALPEIAAAFSPDDVNRAQLVLTSFVLGMGLGTFFVGPISDAVGRKPVIAAGVALYVGAAIAATQGQSLEALLLARFVQGIGASAPRVVGLALVRDIYAGREMARVTSFVMMVFVMIPAVAPSVGQIIINLAGWHGVFWAFAVFSATGLAWLLIRQPETLEPERRRPLRVPVLMAGMREVLGDRDVRIYTAVLTLGFGQMFGLLSSAQQIFAETFGRGDSFPQWFMLMAVLSGGAAALNGKMVMRLGMRRMARTAYGVQAVLSAGMLGLFLSGLLATPFAFPVFFVWAVSLFFMAGVTFGNLNALCLRKMGHIAGLTNSVVSAVSTVLAVAIAAPIGLAFNGTPVPLAIGAVVCSGLAFALMGIARDND